MMAYFHWTIKENDGKMCAIKMEKALWLLPRAAVCAVLSAFVCGCPSKEEPPPDPFSPESYMNDTNFIAGLSAERREYLLLIRERNAIAEKMKVMVDAKREELKTSDLEKVKTELEKDPAWNDLYTLITNANAKAEAQRRKVLGTARARITPRRQDAKPVSK